MFQSDYGLITTMYSKICQNLIFDKTYVCFYLSRVFQLILYYIVLIRPLE